MLFDTSDPVVDEEQYKLKYWPSSEFGNVQYQEEIPHNMS